MFVVDTVKYLDWECQWKKWLSPDSREFSIFQFLFIILYLYSQIEKYENPHRFSSAGLDVVHRLSSKWRLFMAKIFDYDHELFPSMKHYFTAVYSRDKEYL